MRNQPSRKALAVSSRAPPVLAEDLGAAHLDLALFARRDGTARVVDHPDLDAGQRQAHMSRAPFAGERVRQCHADLGHAVAFEQGVAGDLAPPLERRHGKGGRARYHEAGAGRSRDQRRRTPGGASSQARISRAYTVGTDMKSVISPDARRSQVEAGAPEPNSHAAPDQSAQARAFTTPWMWCSGSVCRIRSSAVQPHAVVSAVIWAARLRWVVSAPLGRPVVPLV